jgi:hypothetical protein
LRHLGWEDAAALFEIETDHENASRRRLQARSEPSDPEL